MTTPIDPKAMELVDKFNQFIKKWCGDKFPHLIDSDENDGESFREAIVCLASQPKPCNDSVGKLSEQYKVLIAKCERFLDSSPKTMKVSRESVLSAVCNLCPNCLGAGFTAYETGGCDPDGENDSRESHQDQCQWCYTKAEKATDEIMKLLEGSK